MCILRAFQHEKERDLGKKGMKDLLNVPNRDREHYMKCPICERYFDMRDLAQVIGHEHWPETPPVTFSHSVKAGRESEVHVPTKRGMVTLRPAKAQGVTNKKQRE